ncbi:MULTISPECIES: type 1 glutamine amidotransferase domain-containing protein [unclassified Halomonas]|uniref:type 1 glutamine amidotransferase domain-containing protein n=1 Tax=unclassified Halomonas TaxID=2609666 RepID=UPI0007F13F5D|nr:MULTISPECIES: type 1 glutamine amidotransferase domain-containing protein [unclassified Halomonas]SBR45810.1 Putative intracellular protease/amidase [Halomonas sp. HL-93]SNY98460.1 Putative intracellular protease/amidase [Halomonas sp. hl-4]
MRVLIILSEATHIQGSDGLNRETGYWLEEFALPYQYLTQRGIDITVATPTGKLPVPDPASLDVDGAGECKNWEQPDQFQYGLQLHRLFKDERMFASLADLSSTDLNAYKGVFVPGGYAPMVDLASNKSVGRVLWHFHCRGLPTALFCHGPIALLSTGRTQKGFAYEGYAVTAFSQQEEADTELGRVIVQDAPTALTQAGCLYRNGGSWSSFTVKDRELVTGQNTQSTHAVMQTFYTLLKEA